jgi:NAD(P)-dependent dehydrogenase (short-subunit alcohol dehydrogenase family)
MTNADFAGRVALVTGAASGIGRATALHLAARGADLALVDLDAGRGAALAAMIEETGRKTLFLHADVSDPTAVASAVDRVVDHFGRLDHAFNNAGIEGPRRVPVGELSDETWQRIIAVNLNAVFFCMKHELRVMSASGGTIVNNSSVAGLQAAINAGAAYAASKHGVIGLTRTAAKEYAGMGIRVNAVCPGGTDTPLLERMIGRESMTVSGSSSPAGRIALPQEIAETVAWLLGPSSSFVNGQALVVDGASSV